MTYADVKPGDLAWSAWWEGSTNPDTVVGVKLRGPLVVLMFSDMTQATAEPTAKVFVSRR